MQEDPNKYSFLEIRKNLDKKMRKSRNHFVFGVLLLVIVLLVYFLYPMFFAAYNLLVLGDSVNFCTMQANQEIPDFLGSKECEELINAYVPNKLDSYKIENLIMSLVNEEREKLNIHELKRDIDMDLLSRYKNKNLDDNRPNKEISLELGVDITSEVEINEKIVYCSYIEGNFIKVPIRLMYLKENDNVDLKIAKFILSELSENNEYYIKAVSKQTCSLGLSFNYDREKEEIIAVFMFRSYDNMPQI